MGKIKIELEMPDNKYCDNVEYCCPCCYYDSYGNYRCALFDVELEIDENHGYCTRCDKCKQAEVKDEN